jgi:hypothetical protein
MLTVQIGAIVGMSHERLYTRDGEPVLSHRAHRAITAPVEGFHLGPGTWHLMRPYVVESLNGNGYWAFTWETYCGMYRIPLDAQGGCREPKTTPSVWCHRCQLCQRFAAKGGGHG